MTTTSCPHCGLELDSRQPASSLICPRCFIPFAFASSNQWTILVVPVLAIAHYVNFVL